MTYYRINVAKTVKRGEVASINHIFATAKHSLRSPYDAQECWKLFKEKFPESEGYLVDLQYWEHTGRCVNPETMQIE